MGSVCDAAAAERTLSASIASRDAIRSVAAALHGVERFLIVGSGADRIAARELALKIEEGVRVPATARDLETILHGHWVAVDERTAVVLLLTDGRGGGARAARAGQMLRAAGAIGARTAAIVVPSAALGLPEDAISYGSADVPEAHDLPPATASLLASAPALQLLTLELVHLAGVNPDLIRREEAPYREAARIAESDFPPHG
jgi:glucosamine 6-phosphate synthetase-like amidotransferase/phosphosugar isomerase protein